MKISIERLFLLLIATWAVGTHAAPSSEEDELALAYGDKSFVTIASGSRQPIARAPSVATVVTAEDIAAIGAVDLDEVLETVPGLHVARSVLGYNPIYTIRGVNTQYNPQVLMLVNGIPITGVFVGDRSQIWAGMPVENIARIEVIRGPGSALYGADAFSGVINIITKTATDVDGTELGIRAGSFDSRDGWVQHGGPWGAFEVAAYLRAGKTNGQRQIITADVLSGSPFSSYSLAPGPVNLERDAIDGRFDLSRDKWRLRTGYQQRSDAGDGAGTASALDPAAKNFGERISADLTYQDTNFAPDLDVTAQASYFYITEQSDLTLYPPGIDFNPAPGVDFPNGVIGNPYKWERHTRFNVSASYTGLQKHKLRFGTGTQNDDLYRTQESKNFFLFQVAPGQYLPVPLPGGLTEMDSSNIFINPHNRRVNYVYAQDEWAFTQDWYLTAGVRHDHYSDFGNTTNPRLALVWEAAYNLTAKVLYGHAFRPPSFAELYNINNPVGLGNPNLKPESIESRELAFVWQATSAVQANLNLFHYQMKDILRFVQDPGTGISTAQNAGRQHGQGMEVELVWDAATNLRLSGNYAQQRSIDETTNQDAGNAPRHHVYARADWRFMPRWILDTQLNYIADRKREPGDARPAIADYHTVDLTLRSQKRSSDWGLAFSVRNLFDADAREPSPAPGLIPNDLPLAPREWRFDLSYQL